VIGQDALVLVQLLRLERRQEAPTGIIFNIMDPHPIVTWHYYPRERFHIVINQGGLPVLP
jgi:hypothetical protein